MSAHWHERSTCRLCGSGDLEVVIPLAATPPADHYVTATDLGRVQDSYPLDVRLCRDCGHAQLGVVVDPRHLYGDYIYVTSSSPGLDDHFARYAASVLERYPVASGGTVVDVGSNDGSLLRHFAGHGLRVLGVEPARRIAEQASAAGVETIAAFLDGATARTIVARTGGAALVTANNVFANVDDLDDFTTAVATMLRPDGLFIVETSYLVDLVRNMVWDTIYHEHLSYFTVTPLVRFFESHGLHLVHAERVGTKGGSVRVFVAKDARKVDPSVAAMAAEERACGIATPERFTAFMTVIEDRKAQLVDLVERAATEGRVVDGYGASNTTTTLLYHYGIGPLIRQLIDDNPIKQGRYSPGLHIPVVPFDGLRRMPPDDVLIIAWRFANAITPKVRRVLPPGARVIVPLPEVTVD